MKNQCCGCAQQSGGTEHRENTQHDPEGETQGYLLRSDSLGEKVDDGPDQTTVEETPLHAAFLTRRLERGSSGFSLKSWMRT